MFRASKLHPDAIIPHKAHSSDAGYDLSAAEPCLIASKSWGLVSTGIALQIPEDCYARVAPRSGLSSKKGVDVGAGVVDSGYRNEIKVLLFNHHTEDLAIQKGDRIAQLIFEKIYTPSTLIEVSYEELSCSDRGVCGFGSTGV
jgi:deoxyuridine 5'-triphosphate nucleotidohydrolase